MFFLAKSRIKPVQASSASISIGIWLTLAACHTASLLCGLLLRCQSLLHQAPLTREGLQASLTTADSIRTILFKCKARSSHQRRAKVTPLRSAATLTSRASPPSTSSSRPCPRTPLANYPRSVSHGASPLPSPKSRKECKVMAAGFSAYRFQARGARRRSARH